VDLSRNDAVQVIRETVASTGAPEVVIHAASKQPGSGSLSDFVRANVQTSFNLLQALSEYPPKQVIYTSTLSVYGPGLSCPVSEGAPAVAPQSYPATKRWAEEVMQCWKGCQVTVFRMPSLYGQGQADSFIDGLARLAVRGEPLELYSRGELVRDALHVNDIVFCHSKLHKPPTICAILTDESGLRTPYIDHGICSNSNRSTRKLKPADKDRSFSLTT
jgi:UDP-glucuronate 4-epimerase